MLILILELIIAGSREAFFSLLNDADWHVRKTAKHGLEVRQDNCLAGI